jgi:chitinase
MLKIYTLTLVLFSQSIFAQIPKPALVGYWQNWSTDLPLTSIENNYNIIQLAFATTVGSSLSNMEFALPSNYTKTTFLADIDILHSEGKVVILSIGGANDPVRLDDTNAKNQFVTTINKILSDINYKIDGIDLDLESTSMNFGSAWTMTSMSTAQSNLVAAVNEIMVNYKTLTNKKLLLTMAPETIYLMGALSNYQINNLNGGAMLPIIQALSTELDLLHCQYYNAGGASGGTFAIDGTVYYDNSDPDYITSMTESIIKGFTLLNGKGVYSGIPASKIAIGLPSDKCASAGTGYNTPTDVCLAAKYLQGKISKPTGWSYNVTKPYADIAGLMCWSVNNDQHNCDGAYGFAKNFTCAFPSITTGKEYITPEFSSKMSVYPNPTNGEIHVNVSGFNSDYHLEISNMNGQVIWKTELVEGRNDLTEFKAKTGIYFAKMKVGSEYLVQKLVVN